MYIYSTLSQNIDFGFVVVNGGAGVTNRVSLDTPNGVATSVTSEQFNLLKENESFKSFVKKGGNRFIKKENQTINSLFEIFIFHFRLFPTYPI